MQCFGPFAFYDVAGKEVVQEGSSSLVNRVEVEMVLCLYRELVHRYPHLKRTPRGGGHLALQGAGKSC